MKKAALVSLFTAMSFSAQADTWAFESNEKVVDDKIGAVLVMVQEEMPSWTFSEADAQYLVKDFESYSFQ